METDYKKIASDIKRTLAGKGITLAKAAQMLGITPQAINNQLSGRPISRKTATAYNREFGFDINYMLTGQGVLSDDTPSVPVQTGNGVYLPQETLAMYTSMAASIEKLTDLVNRLSSPVMPKGKRGNSFLDEATGPQE